MDLILLQPGDPSFFPAGDWSSSGTLDNSHLQDAYLNTGAMYRAGFTASEHAPILFDEQG